MREEIIGDARLILGDCREVLPTLSGIDAVVTDPPYGMNLDADFSKMNNASGFKGLGSGNSYAAVIGDNVDFDPDFLMAIASTRVLFGADYYIDKLPPDGSLSIWDKRLDESADKAFGSSYETIWFSPKRKKDMLRHKWFGLFGTEREDVKTRVHPTQKPIEVMLWCLRKLPEFSGAILDPFMGSGTTGVACAKLGRKFIGIEIDPGYFEIACKRIQKAYDQPDMFISPPHPKPIQGELIP